MVYGLICMHEKTWVFLNLLQILISLSMKQSSDRTNQVKSATNSIQHPLTHSETCWYDFGTNAVSQGVLDFSSSRPSMTSRPDPDGSLRINVLELQANSGKDVGSNIDGEPKSTRLLKTDGNCKYEYFNISTSAPIMGESFRPDPQLKLVGHSVACSEPYYWGASPANAQPWVHSDVHDLNHPRVALPLEVAEEPVYVNAKQYHGILRRRQLRAKAELENKVARAGTRKPYLHESRHLHAMRRARGCGGRFLSSKKNKTSNGNATSQKGTHLNVSVSTDEHMSTCSESTFSRSSGNIDFSGGCQESQGMQNSDALQWGYQYQWQLQ